MKELITCHWWLSQNVANGPSTLALSGVQEGGGLGLQVSFGLSWNFFLQAALLTIVPSALKTSLLHIIGHACCFVVKTYSFSTLETSKF